MNIFDLRELAEAASGRIVRLGDPLVAGISTDSRTIEKGSLFVAINGERFDGHRFADHALRKGAAAVMVSNLEWDDPDRDFAKDRTIILVDDTVKALGAMAAWWRRKCGWKVVGVTGSCGKTSTKEMVRLALAARWDTGSTAGNLNNEIGLPISILAAPPDLDVFVAEMGMNHPGEISRLAAISAPDAGIFTSVAPVHLEFLESLDNIAAAKAEMVPCISPGGAIVWDSGDPYTSAIGGRGVEERDLMGVPVSSGFAFPEIFPGLYDAAGMTAAKPRSDGFQALFRAKNLRIDGQGHPSYDLVCNTTGEIFAVSIPAFGTVNVMNSLLAIAGAAVMGVEPQAAAKAMAGFRSVGSRMRRESLPCGADLLDDSYNSNPLSLHLALMDLTKLPCRGRRYLVAGDMLELGKRGDRLHEVSLRFALSQGIDSIHAVGPLMARAAQRIGDARVRVFEDPCAAGSAVARILRPGDAVLVKGSRGMRLEGAVAPMRGDGSRPDSAAPLVH